MRQYIDSIGIVLIVWGALQLLPALMIVAMALLYGGLGAMMVGIGIVENEPDLMPGGIFTAIFGGIMFLPALFLGATAALTAISGWGVTRRRSWARIAAIVAGALASMQCFPLGALVAVFTILVMVDKDVAAEFELHEAARE